MIKDFFFLLSDIYIRPTEPASYVLGRGILVYHESNGGSTENMADINNMNLTPLVTCWFSLCFE
jgi:hypothetical protein